MGVADAPGDITLEKHSASDSGAVAGWFRFTVEDIEFWARADSQGRFDVFLANSTPHDGPIQDLADPGKALARRNPDTVR